ncbi:type II toxin-antitoxin system RelE/ParE family toxin [Candidatus Saganbacteria bacterium]|nr:type II toxin-antitoxin system RelE/ParE family toxin [Candidatus Saganbacteria bacterium]
MTNKEESKNNFTVKLASKRVEKELDALPRNEYNKIAREIKGLAIDPRPHGVKKLSDRAHRLRIGNYRVIYSVFDKEKIVLVDTIVRRSENTYKNY